MALAPTQVALELSGNGVATGLWQLGGVLLLLQLRDVLGDFGVVGGQLVDAALPGARQLRQVAEIERGRRADSRAGTSSASVALGQGGWET